MRGRGDIAWILAFNGNHVREALIIDVLVPTVERPCPQGKSCTQSNSNNRVETTGKVRGGSDAFAAGRLHQASCRGSSLSHGTGRSATRRPLRFVFVVPVESSITIMTIIYRLFGRITRNIVLSLPTLFSIVTKSQGPNLACVKVKSQSEIPFVGTRNPKLIQTFRKI